ncbi:unnamed protein product [Trichogramma brassicae]|uniref:CCHC-type domain-containing protein n=1 Tax=Trichogramma brassicae TaxID=86971 RepID=A0A6H5J0N4_9HYME|nr:unnamed protein product [Trichogramma brassicae]
MASVNKSIARRLRRQRCAERHERGEPTPPVQVHRLTPCIIRHGVMFGRLNGIPTEPYLDPPMGSCFACWSQGHRARECPQPQEQHQYCVNCGRRDRVLRNCERCSRRWSEIEAEAGLFNAAAPLFGELEWTTEEQRRMNEWAMQLHQLVEAYERMMQGWGELQRLSVERVLGRGSRSE